MRFAEHPQPLLIWEIRWAERYAKTWVSGTQVELHRLDAPGCEVGATAHVFSWM